VREGGVSDRIRSDPEGSAFLSSDHPRFGGSRSREVDREETAKVSEDI